MFKPHKCESIGTMSLIEVWAARQKRLALCQVKRLKGNQLEAGKRKHSATLSNSCKECSKTKCLMQN